jgi:1-acyl-sn-glycerol-3-phosphate acyltransferase
MNMVTVASPALKAVFGRLGVVNVIDRPDILGAGGPGAVIVCNHVGWADSLWLGYAMYPRPLRFLSKQELFDTPMSKWLFEHSGCIAIDRGEPSPSSIKTVVDVLRGGEVILIFPSGTRQRENAVFKRGAATIALHAQVPLVPAFYRGPQRMRMAHLIDRPRIEVAFGAVIPTVGLAIDRTSASRLTGELKAAIDQLDHRNGASTATTQTRLAQDFVVG